MATTTAKATPFFVYLGRVFFALAFLALLGAWLSPLAGGTVFGFSQQHLFNDAIVLSLFGIGMFLDALWHSRNI
jgi:hypothetical protein